MKLTFDSQINLEGRYCGRGRGKAVWANKGVVGQRELGWWKDGYIPAWWDYPAGNRFLSLVAIAAFLPSFLSLSLLSFLFHSFLSFPFLSFPFLSFPFLSFPFLSFPFLFVALYIGINHLLCKIGPLRVGFWLAEGVEAAWIQRGLPGTKLSPPPLTPG